MNHQGFLKMMIVQQLMREPTSGYLLVKIINEKTGWKPSYGSIYPMLAAMETAGLVSVETRGRSKIYSLTAQGKTILQEQNERREEALTQIIGQLKVLASMDDEHAARMATMLEQIKSGAVPFRDIPEIPQFHDLFHELETSGALETKSKEIRKILARTTRELKKLI